ncbi:MAG: DUF1697 domain-containing protein [Pirellula sp.]
MTKYIALLRAVNVGGTGKLPMSDLKSMCVDAGFTNVQTYIASGNVLFQSQWAASKVKSTLEAKLLEYAGREIGVVVRTAAEMKSVMDSNPFSDKAPNQTVAIFLDKPPAKDALNNVHGKANELLALGKREIFVFYADGIGRSKLKIDAAKLGTARNMNTIAKLVSLYSDQ